MSERNSERGAFILDAVVCMAKIHDERYFDELIGAGVNVIQVTATDEDEDGFDGTIRNFSRWHDAIARNKDRLMLVRSGEDLRQARASGRLGIVLGMQDIRALEGDLTLLPALVALGVRVIQLTYQTANAAGCGCGEENDTGLTRFGRRLVERLNEERVAVDLSHVGPRTSAEALEVSRAPCVITHSGVRRLCDHVRNKTDEQLRALADRGGVFGVAAYAPFLDHRGNKKPGLDQFLDSIEHACRVAGDGRVGLGLDSTPGRTPSNYTLAAAKYPEIYRGFGYEEAVIAPLDCPSTAYAAITQGLRRRGFEGDRLAGVLGENFARVFTEIWDG